MSQAQAQQRRRPAPVTSLLLRRLLGRLSLEEPLGGPLTTPGETIRTLAFGAGGTTLYAGSAHVPLQRYDTAPSHALARVCARAGGAGPSRAVWRTYVPDAPYRPVCRTEP
ncbi:hypothetical protein [Streptomyces sp. SID12488]|uniref:hypothetical protein n=1 Tax=Streptomyces sp. SID12488 TaxID=2706040 RepID=UPI00194419A9|nr:hypothetical protein [Streptomyces sp. SID12488]